MGIIKEVNVRQNFCPQDGYGSGVRCDTDLIIHIRMRLTTERAECSMGNRRAGAWKEESILDGRI